LLWLGESILAVPISYLAAALVGGLIPANQDWEPPATGITIFVETNGVHTWIVMPSLTREMDWRPFAPAKDLRDPGLDGNSVAIGYGNRDFYLNTPDWKDLTFLRAIGAAFGNGGSLMHVYHYRDPVPGDDMRPIVLTSDQYRKLTMFIAASFDRDASGRTKAVLGRGYGQSDAFYEAHGRYNLFYTCNEWAGAALRQAGVRVGIWTPFTQSIMSRF
jgi:uncharacterized protein (TIGR02117 family)